jgi:hypothetical protein
MQNMSAFQAMFFIQNFQLFQHCCTCRTLNTLELVDARRVQDILLSHVVANEDAMALGLARMMSY